MYKATIGLEIHAELKTKSKMFCSCLNDPDNSEPNTNICPVCMAHPGTLPTINKEAVKHMIKIGLALGGNIADFSEFDRKSYFYPDIPKAYQISQYKYPIVSGGELEGVKITRVHLEEDTARSLHDKSDTHTAIDFNRAGVPLMELVTEPEVQDAEHARRFAKELQHLLRYLGVSDANMEKGQMRVEANVSIQNPDGSFGTKVEVKNLNSFKSVHDAIEYEIKRQIKLIESGEKVVQETRGWDENKGITFSQRSKEDAKDYRYFPDPDLPKMLLHSFEEFDLESLKNELPELPWQFRARLKSYGLQDKIVEFFVDNLQYKALFDRAIESLGEENAKLIANYISSDLASHDIELTENLQNSFVEILKLLSNDDISSRVAKDLIEKLAREGAFEVMRFVEENNLKQVKDTALLESVLKEVLSKNNKAIEDYKAGNQKALGAIIGQSMKALKEQGVSADPRLLNELAKKLIEN